MPVEVICSFLNVLDSAFDYLFCLRTIYEYSSYIAVPVERAGGII